ncbi:LysR substrate-binding domain-containing protein [Sinorhizobium mexicanum]|uniref:LysR family transcriptional regulator n=1 Tax=Sinorhizobium mexicanum TaxID=375549 RepID=A0A859QMN4_9HYPH|nr:LysR substrate-binding domain-containing protein [Sinorhizobium mexicanum]MBP1886483.1 DNA-binding transcriptional LysR family regulator [Sinorhizobium mexicanum]QLL63940.1 LysR family transcriptional regulator [Sinorhizobium mexicanum]
MRKDFSLREVEAFAAVMRHGTVTKAADFLDIAQPGVSKLLAQFESKAGFTVFVRQKQRLIPTPEALTLYAEVERSLVSVREISRVARDIGDLRTGRLKIGVLPALGSGLVPKIVHDFLSQHPTVSATLNIRSTQTLIEWAGRNQIDLAIGVTSQIENPAIVRRQLPPVPIVCVMPKDHILAIAEVVRLKDLEATPFVSLLPSDPLSIQLEQHAAMEGVRLSARIETNLASAAIAFASLGSGVTVIDFLSTQATHLAGMVVKPFEPNLSISYSIYRQRGEKLSAIASAFIEHAIAELSRTIAETATLRRPCNTP